jgi:hypothetical protein
MASQLGVVATFHRDGICRIESALCGATIPPPWRSPHGQHTLSTRVAPSDQFICLPITGSHAQQLYTSLGMQQVASNAVVTYVRSYRDE